ncbi:NAD(+)--arginine ADP-ribosyltransferase [Mycobacteroides chelonae]|uniref:WXG100-like domain-containing protein n=1 Tax=Mycobacteroides chelonae TaxID=1774 RepID=UPI00091BB832|nr:NAD(+)--arginine ADP-ribosyltransferase [Mycobacteroides chelonae]AYM42055.1 NAD(+)--arginine ADP-ribosyltransferase [[Mycobacterium] chelonae subsp. gwanakae]OHU17092.1 hypothetical protein BKG75_00265 [Mycobacteroides chelonae]
MAPVDVDPEVYYAASNWVTFSGFNFESLLKSMSTSMSQSAGMAGTDNTGKEFSTGYDQAVKDTVTILAGLADMTNNAGDIIKVNGDNHKAANQASAGNGGTTPQASVPSRSTTQIPSVPSAYGGSASQPTGLAAKAWNFLSGMVGYIWPDGDEHTLTFVGGVWTGTGSAIEDAAGYLDKAKAMLATQQSPEIGPATAYLDDLKAKYSQVASACRELGTSCNDLAKAIGDAHRELISELEQFAVEFLVGEAVSLVLIEVGGELWGNAILAARASVVARRCASAIEKLIELGRAAARAAKAAAERIAHLLGQMKSAVAALVKRSDTDRNIEALTKYTKQALAEFDSGTIRFSPDQLRAIGNHPGQYNMHKGNVLDEQVKFLVNNDPALRDLTTTGRFKYGPDFVNTNPKAGEAPWYDLTTTGEWAKKLAQAKYENTHGGPGGGIIWNAPEGVKYVPPR